MTAPAKEVPMLRPFAGLRPAPGLAGSVIAPLYDVVSRDEARAHACGRPWSFLHISRPEIDLPPDMDPSSAEVYAAGADHLSRMVRDRILQRDAMEYFYAYRVSQGGHSQTGVVALASVAHYAANRIRRHELTTIERETDRVRHLEALNTQTGPVMAAYPDDPALDALLETVSAGRPDADATDDDCVRHSLWVIRDDISIMRLARALNRLPCIYIADGHHRSAAAARVAAARGTRGAPGRGAASYEYFLTTVFNARTMRILDYNRLIADLGGMSPAAFVARAGERFAVEAASSTVTPSRPGEFGLFVGGAWHRLVIRPELVPRSDALARLDVRLLSDHLLQPILGITDDGHDPRLAYVAGDRGPAELERRVTRGEVAAAVSLFPTRMRDVMAVADSGRVMPPKSTCFAPKLVDGLISHVLD
jgi:uncharacterized protein (DUF1015 family)